MDKDQNVNESDNYDLLETNKEMGRQRRKVYLNIPEESLDSLNFK